MCSIKTETPTLSHPIPSHPAGVVIQFESLTLSWHFAKLPALDCGSVARPTQLRHTLSHAHWQCEGVFCTVKYLSSVLKPKEEDYTSVKLSWDWAITLRTSNYSSTERHIKTYREGFCSAQKWKCISVQRTKSIQLWGELECAFDWASGYNKKEAIL